MRNVAGSRVASAPHPSSTALSERVNSVLAQHCPRCVLYVLDGCYAETAALIRNPTHHAPVLDEALGRFEGRGVITLASEAEVEQPRRRDDNRIR